MSAEMISFQIRYHDDGRIRVKSPEIPLLAIVGPTWQAAFRLACEIAVQMIERNGWPNAPSEPTATQNTHRTQ